MKRKKLNEKQAKRLWANHVITARMDKGMTQAQFAKHLKTSQSMVSKLEKALVLPSYKVLYYLGAI